MFICEIWLLDWYFPQFWKSDVSKYGYLQVLHRVSSTSRYREFTVDIIRYDFDKSGFLAWFSIEPSDINRKENENG